MWRPWSKLLSFFGSIGIRLPRGSVFPALGSGSPQEPDSEGDGRWRAFAGTETLWQTWGPASGSPWEPFHCVTLFAALDRIMRRTPQWMGPLPDRNTPPWLKLSAELPGWAVNGATMLILDLPGSRVISAAFYFILKGAFQPVCTFDNWPNTLGVLKPEQLLGSMLFYAAALSDGRSRLSAKSPPLWICDRDRMSMNAPGPGRYDNRYIIEDRLLPGTEMLKNAGIQTVAYVGPAASATPAPDLSPYLDHLSKQGLPVFCSSIENADAFSSTRPWETPARSQPNYFLTGLMRSSAGGFGGYVPSPSSGG